MSLNQKILTILREVEDGSDFSINFTLTIWQFP